jgi:spore protease
VIGIRTDLAIEAREFYSKQEDKKDIPGVEVDMDKGENYTVTRVKVVEDVGARIMGKPKKLPVGLMLQRKHLKRTMEESLQYLRLHLYLRFRRRIW